MPWTETVLPEPAMSFHPSTQGNLVLHDLQWKVEIETNPITMFLSKYGA
jgi:hypothetical protein